MFIAGHLVIHFHNWVPLAAASSLGGHNIFFKPNKCIEAGWIERWNGSFVMLRTGCSARVFSGDLIINYQGKEVSIPTSLLLEVYVKETGAKIWPVT